MNNTDVSIAADLAPILDPTPLDLEVSAMSAIATVLLPLDDRARARVLAWARERYPTSETGVNIIAPYLHRMLEAVGEHQKASLKQPSRADRAMWDATIRGSKFWTDIPESEDKAS